MDWDVIIIGAGAAGLMCGAIAGARGKRVLLIDHADKPGEKIRISGGGRCNFTNLHSGPDNFISQNPHFCKSALSRYTPQDFVDLVERYHIAWHEKTKGQLFCDGRSQEIIDMLLAECDKAGNTLWLGTEILDVRQAETGGFTVTTTRQSINCDNLVVACGGPSIPKMGASRFGYKLAEQFGLNVIEPVPALVPFTFTDEQKTPLKTLSGVSLPVAIHNDRITFEEDLLFTHRGLSGPAVLQISSYWEPGESVTVNMAPKADVLELLLTTKETAPKKHIKTVISEFLPQRLAEHICKDVKKERLADMSNLELRNIALLCNAQFVKPAGTEGFRTAEVTRGGVDTDELSSKTMECRKVPGLYFIGEVVDVTGHLGGHNFQWAWACAVAAGEAL